MNRPIRVQFVCLGNICRSPLAEGVFRHLVRERGLEQQFEIASSGTGSWHVGNPPDHRMQQTARNHDISLDGQRADQFQASHLAYFDHIFAMDKSNLNDILYFDQDDEHGYKVRLFREFDPQPDDFQVPDPYYGGSDGFENVYHIVHRTAQTILDRLVEEYEVGQGA